MSRRSSQAQARAAADLAYLEQVRGDSAGAAAAGDRPPSAAPMLPTPGNPEPLAHPDVMPHVASAAPSPALGVSPILGEQGHSSAPPVGSFSTPVVGPPGPAFPSQTASAAAGTAATQQAEQGPAPLPPGAPGPVEQPAGIGPGMLRKVGSHREPSFIEQSPSGVLGGSTATLAPPQYYAAPPYAPPQQYSAPPYAGPAPLTSPGPDLPLLLGPDGIAPTGDLVTCPECGEMATVDAAKRNSQDFCRNCDFPLFWARSTVILPSGQETGASLRRLPGTVGRAATAALLCPHCGEPNSPTAQTCVRCLLSLHPVEPPPPVPVYLPPPPPPPVPVPMGREYPLWWILLVSGCSLAIILLVVWMAVN